MDDASPEGRRGNIDSETQPESQEGRETSRLKLVLDVLVFQFKLAADGLRDVLLSPLSLISAVMGLIAGGDDPHRYFRDLKRLGRRTEVWINLFGHHSRGTSDDLIDPLRQRVMTEAQSNPWLSRAGGELNKQLDSVGERIRSDAQDAGSKSRPSSGKNASDDQAL